jgi:hypothetical protein
MAKLWIHRLRQGLLSYFFFLCPAIYLLSFCIKAGQEKDVKKEENSVSTRISFSFLLINLIFFYSLLCEVDLGMKEIRVERCSQRIDWELADAHILVNGHEVTVPQLFLNQSLYRQYTLSFHFFCPRPISQKRSK